MAKRKSAIRHCPLLLFDSGFFNHFIDQPRDKSHEDWQRFFVGEVNKIIARNRGANPICTPSLFLEYIWAGGIERPRFGLRENRKITAARGLGESIFVAVENFIEEARRHFATLPSLQPGNLISLSNIKRNLHTSNSPHAKLFADLTFQRFKALGDFDKQIYLFLALDALQGEMERKGKNRFYQLAQLQHFKDMLEVMEGRRNVPMFRLMRSIIISILPQTAARKKVIRLRKASDLADCDYVHYAVFGYRSAKGRHRVTVFTCDPLDKVIFRLRAAKFLFHVLAFKVLKTTLQRLNVRVPRPCFGKVYVCSPSEPKIIRKITVKNLSHKRLF